MVHGIADIESNLGDTQEKATALKNAADQLAETQSVENDTQTTVAGNANAQHAIATINGTAQEIAKAVLLASNNLRSVAEEFEALDRQLVQTQFLPIT